MGSTTFTIKSLPKLDKLAETLCNYNIPWEMVRTDREITLSTEDLKRVQEEIPLNIRLSFPPSVFSYCNNLGEKAGDTWTPQYSRWRHGGWYVNNVRHKSGACGCVSNNYDDKKWRIVCGDENLTFSTRDEAARAEKLLADASNEQKAERGWWTLTTTGVTELTDADLEHIAALIKEGYQSGELVHEPEGREDFV